MSKINLTSYSKLIDFLNQNTSEEVKHCSSKLSAQYCDRHTFEGEDIDGVPTKAELDECKKVQFKVCAYQYGVQPWLEKLQLVCDTATSTNKLFTPAQQLAACHSSVRDYYYQTTGKEMPASVLK